MDERLSYVFSLSSAFAKASHRRLSLTTRSSTRITAAQNVSTPRGSSPAARVSPTGHATHAFAATRSSNAHAHAVSPEVRGSSPASRVDPPVHATQSPFESTR